VAIIACQQCNLVTARRGASVWRRKYFGESVRTVDFLTAVLVWIQPSRLSMPSSLGVVQC
jgi:hypothetical protein